VHLLKRLIIICALILGGITSPHLAEGATISKMTVGGDRPVTVQLPAKLTKPAPLLLLMHSASSSGERQEKNTKLAAAAKKAGMIFLAPDGTVGLDGRRVWNAAKACCQKPGIEVDDITYLNALIDEIALLVPVDQNRIYMVGHSNGGFMSLAFACSTGRIAGVVSLAGALDADAQCNSAKPFSFLHIHGTEDATIKFGGGVHNFHPYTGAEETLSRIANVNQCAAPAFTPAAVKKMDFDRLIPGQETIVQSGFGCKAPTVLWRISGGVHSPKLPTNYAEQVVAFLLKGSNLIK
jgi:polyhydroxybutyrate depolymerase